MDYRHPDGRRWKLLDEASLQKLAEESAHSNLMRGEPGNCGIDFEQACGVLKTLSEKDVDVSDLIPDRFV